MEIAVLLLMLTALHIMGLPVQNKHTQQELHNEQREQPDERSK